VRDQLERKAIVVEGDLVTGDALLVEISFHDESVIAAEPGEIGFPHEHSEEFRPGLNPLSEIELRALLAFGFEDQLGIHADEVLAVPFAVVVVLAGKIFFVPARIVVAIKEVELEMHVGSFFGDAFACVAGATHHGNLFAGVDSLTNFQAVADCAQMRVEGINFDAVDGVSHHDIPTIIGKLRMIAEVGNGAVGSSHDWIGRFPVLVALEAFDVETFVHLPTIGTDASETTAFPGLACGADEKAVAAIFFEEGMIGGWKIERLSGCGAAPNCR